MSEPQSMTRTVYMDCNATAPLRLQARDAMARVLDGAVDAPGNPSSVHAQGRAARRIVEDAREQVRALVNAPASARVIFTSGGTEANALALNGCGREIVLAPGTEHPSVLNARAGIERIRVSADGLIDPFELDERFAGGGDDIVVSVMLANNETGVLQQVEGIARVAHRYDALVHTDAVQAAGKVDVDFQALGVDYLTLSAHKLGGPQGVGALIAAKDAPLQALQPGGGQEGGLRGGTENVPAIAGFGAAAQAAKAAMSDDAARVRALRDRLEAGVLGAAPGATVIAHMTDRLPNTALIVMPGVASETQVMAFDLDGYCVSAGSACASGKAKQSGVLAAMGVSPEDAKCAVRVSLGQHNTQAEIDGFISAWTTLYHRKGGKRSAA